MATKTKSPLALLPISIMVYLISSCGVAVASTNIDRPTSNQTQDNPEPRAASRPTKNMRENFYLAITKQLRKKYDTYDSVTFARFMSDQTKLVRGKGDTLWVLVTRMHVTRDGNTEIKTVRGSLGTIRGMYIIDHIDVE